MSKIRGTPTEDVRFIFLVPRDLATLVDDKAAELTSSTGVKHTRSDIARMAMRTFLASKKERET